VGDAAACRSVFFSLAWRLNPVADRLGPQRRALTPPRPRPAPPPPPSPLPEGTLPPLPASLVALDVGGNLGLEGDITDLDLGGLQEARLGNNSFTGGVPKSALKSK
jgi:hypothetical protein